METCPACTSKTIRACYSIDRLPLLLFPVSEKARREIRQDGIDSYYCQDCSHIFTEDLSKDNARLIYEEYYQFYPYDNLESMMTHYRQPFEEFFERVFRNLFKNRSGNEKLLEIGSSSGEQLEFFAHYGMKCYGIDPSPLNVADQDRIYKGLYQDYRFETTFEIIIARFVLEHINLPHEFMQKIHRDLTDDGLVVIQVPNTMEFIRNSIPSFLAHEHTQYFNMFSLIQLAERTGFDVLDIQYLDQQSIVVALAKKKTKSGASAFQNPYSDEISRFLQKRKEFRIDVCNLISRPDSRICFYGSGLMLTWILYDLGYAYKVADGLVLDDNPLVHEKLMPQSGYRVVGFSMGLLKDYDTVLLTLNPVYHAAIVEKLRKAGYQGVIYALNRNGLETMAG